MGTTLDTAARRSKPNLGYLDEILIPLNGIGNASFLPLSGTTTPEITTAGATSMPVIKWDFIDDSGDKATISFQLPRTFKANPTPTSTLTPKRYKTELKVRVRIRKIDATADENTDLKFYATMTWRNPAGTSVLALATPASSGVLTGYSTGNANTDSDGWVAYTLDIGARVDAESLDLQRGAACVIAIYPHETVGSADMTVEMEPPTIEFGRHAQAVQA